MNYIKDKQYCQLLQNDTKFFFVISEGTNDPALIQGDTVLVLGASPRRGHLLVAHNNTSLHVPFQFLELKPCPFNI